MTAPYVIARCAMSLDAYLDDQSDTRLILSHPDDLDRADEVRAWCDAILVGANTIRRDNPRLVVRSDARVRQRLADGRTEQPTKVSLTRAGALDPHSDFFTAGTADRVVYCAGDVGRLQARIASAATVVPMPDAHALEWVLEDLGRRGIRRLLVEGGSQVLTSFLAGGLVDELQVSIAPFFVGHPGGPRIVGAARFPFDQVHRMPLRGVERAGDMVVVTYQLR